MKIFGFKAIVAAVILAALSTAALAQKEGGYSHENAGIQFSVPEGWNVEADGDALIVGPASGEVSVMLYVVEADTMVAAAEALDAYLASALTDLEVTEETSEIKINGLTAFTGSGKGKMEGTPVEYTVMIVLGKKPLMIFGVLETASIEKNSKQVQSFINSIGPIN